MSKALTISHCEAAYATPKWTDSVHKEKALEKLTKNNP